MSNIRVEGLHRVNSASLAAHTGQPVLLVGVATSPAADGRITLTAADKQPVTVILGGCAVPPGRVLEVSGSVRADKSVQASAITALSDNFDMDAYNDAVKVFPAFKMIF